MREHIRTAECARVVVLLLLFGRFWTRFCFFIGRGHDFAFALIDYSFWYDFKHLENVPPKEYNTIVVLALN